MTLSAQLVNVGGSVPGLEAPDVGAAGGGGRHAVCKVARGSVREPDFLVNAVRGITIPDAPATGRL
jgi:hypothetical protein